MSFKEVWEGDWKQRINQRLRAKRYDSLISFFKANYGKTFEEIIALLDSSQDLAHIQLTWFLEEEAYNTSQIDWFAKDNLIREIRERCENGWDNSIKAISAISSWSVTMKDFGEESFEIFTDMICERLKAIVPSGWLPIDIKDPIIEQAFAGISFNITKKNYE
jgi:hypothetical protein